MAPLMVKRGELALFNSVHLDGGTMKRAWVWVLVASLSLLTLSTACLAAGTPAHQLPPEQSTWATWITRDVEIDLKDLPRPYTCDELFYKLRAILFAIGAREYMAITPYQCGAKAAGGGHAPTLDLKFQTLRALSGLDARWAQTRAVRRVVRIAPGEPKIIDANDCALLSQLSGTLFSYLEMHVLASDLKCSKPRTAQKFSISFEALIAKPSDHPPA
jgi:hypothetical protein